MFGVFRHECISHSYRSSPNVEVGIFYRSTQSAKTSLLPTEFSNTYMKWNNLYIIEKGRYNFFVPFGVAATFRAIK